MKAIILNISEVSDFSVEEIEIDKDHIHVLLRMSPKYSIGQHVRLIKQQANKLIWQQYPDLKRQFWVKKTFWSDGYFVCSVGNALLIQFGNTFKSKVSLSIHPRDFRFARITGFSRRIR